MTDSDYIAIRRLQSSYADIVTRRAWDEIDALFEPDARVRLELQDRDPMVFQGGVAIGRFIGESIERFEFFQFVILNTVVDIEGADATGRMYMTELRQDHDGRWTQIFGLYLDRYRRDDSGVWRFGDRRYHSLARPTTDLTVFGLPDDMTLP